MKKLHIAKGLTLPLEVVTQTIGILAKRRAGKSYAMRRFAEQLFKAGQQIVIVDPKGDQWGIRSAADGVSPGLPVVILGGERADVPLEVHGGEIVAKLVVEERASVLLDLSVFRKREVAVFMSDFLENLYRLKAREIYRTPMMLILDEADAIAPQKPMDGEQRMLGAAEDIVRRGGQRGIGCTLVTQRSAVINKNVLTQIQILITLRTIAPQDLSAIDAWVDVHGTNEERKTLKESLPALPVGDAWVWSPGWPTVEGIFQRVHVLPIETFDSAATPKPGERRIEPKNLADVDLDALSKQMAATIERAKATDPKELNRRVADRDKTIRELKAQIEKSATAKPAIGKETIKKVEKPVVLAKHLQRMEKYRDALESIIQRAASLLDGAKVAQVEIVKVIGDAKAVNAQTVATTAPPRPTVREEQTRDYVPIKPARQVMADLDKATTNGEISGVMQKILDAIAEFEVMGIDRVPKVQAAFMAGYSNLMSKSFANAMGSLRSAGYITYPDSDSLAFTNAGRALANDVSAPLSTEELQGRIRELLGGVHENIIKQIIPVYPDAVEKADLAKACGYSNVMSKSFANALGRLRTLGFIDYPSTGYVAATNLLFPAGLN